MILSQTSAAETSALNDVSLGLSELPAAAISALGDIKRKFSNQRQWREIVTAVQCTVNYPAVLHTLHSGKKWFSDGLTQASNLTTMKR
jgi:hypothetical protein